MQRSHWKLFLFFLLPLKCNKQVSCVLWNCIVSRRLTVPHPRSPLIWCVCRALLNFTWPVDSHSFITTDPTKHNDLKHISLCSSAAWQRYIIPLNPQPVEVSLTLSGLPPFLSTIKFDGQQSILYPLGLSLCVIDIHPLFITDIGHTQCHP